MVMSDVKEEEVVNRITKMDEYSGKFQRGESFSIQTFMLQILDL